MNFKNLESSYSKQLAGKFHADEGSKYTQVPHNMIQGMDYKSEPKKNFYSGFWTKQAIKSGEKNQMKKLPWDWSRIQEKVSNYTGLNFLQ